MARKKLKKFEKARNLPNVFLKDRLEDKEKIKEKIKNYQKIFLELAAGRGEYTLYLAEKNPDTLCIAIDFRSDRLLWGATKALEKNLKNALFFRARVEEIINYFRPNSVDKIWLPFPDPFPKKRHEKHRLTNPFYLKIYKQILKPKAFVYFKTDSKELFEYTLENLRKFDTEILMISQNLFTDFEEHNKNPEIQEIILSTKYQKEAIIQNKKIYFIKFSFS